MRYGLAAALIFASASAMAQPSLSPAKAAAFKAAGFVLKGSQWRQCDDPGTASYAPGSLEEAGDLNGDGQPEALVTEGSTFCYGDTGQGFALVSRQADGKWKLVTQSVGVPRFLGTKGTAGWPDLEIGGPGFCFPVQRWNGREYAVQRYQYEDKPRRPE
jgi:hypothetical protein